MSADSLRTVSLPDLQQQLAADCGMDRQQAHDFIQQLLGIVADELCHGRSVKIKGIGTFATSVATASRRGASGDAIPAADNEGADGNSAAACSDGADDNNRLTVVYTPDSRLAAEVNAPFAMFQPMPLPAGTDLIFDDEPQPSAKLPPPAAPQRDAVATEAPAEAQQPVAQPQAQPVANLSSCQPLAADVRSTQSCQPLAAESPSTQQDKPEAQPQAAIDVPATDNPATEVPATDNPTDDMPADEVPTDEVPTDDMPTDEVPADEVPADDEQPQAAAAHLPYISNPVERVRHDRDPYVRRGRRRRYLRGLATGLGFGILIGLIGGLLLYKPMTRLMGFDLVTTEVDIAAGKQRPTLPPRQLAAASAVTNDSLAAARQAAAITRAATEQAEARVAAMRDTVTAKRYLATMARDHYGCMEYWIYIYRANPGLGHPDRIEPGTVVTIPAKSTFMLPTDKQTRDEACRLTADLYRRYGKKV